MGVLRRWFPPSRKEIWDGLAKNGGRALLIETAHGAFWALTGDGAIGRSLWVKGHFDRDTFLESLGLLDRFAPLPPDATFLDGGANIGTHSVYALGTRRFAKVIAVEPDHENARLLRLNIEENAYVERVTVVESALGDREGTAELALSPGNFGDHRIHTALARDTTERVRRTVPLTTLDSLVDLLGCDPASTFLHLDVQGYEPFVMAGGAGFLSRTPAVLTEFWPHGMRESGGTNLFNQLTRRFFKRYVVVGDNKDRPIDTLDELFQRHAMDMGTNLLLIK